MHRWQWGVKRTRIVLVTTVFCFLRYAWLSSSYLKLIAIHEELAHEDKNTLLFSGKIKCTGFHLTLCVSHFYTDISLLFATNNNQICVKLCHLSGSCTDSNCLGISWFLLLPLASLYYQLPLEVQSAGFSLQSPSSLSDSLWAVSRGWGR